MLDERGAEVVGVWEAAEEELRVRQADVPVEYGEEGARGGGALFAGCNDDHDGLVCVRCHGYEVVEVVG